MPSLLHYRSWQGAFHSPWWTTWPIARVAVRMVLRRIMFWVLYADSLLLFLMFFFGNFLLAWFQARTEASRPQLGAIGNPDRLIAGIRRALNVLNGSQETFQYFFAYQGGIVIVTLALVGSVLVGNDFTFKSLVFYLAKPIGRWHYILGKCLAVFFVVQMMTTLPASRSCSANMRSTIGIICWTSIISAPCPTARAPRESCCCWRWSAMARFCRRS